MESEQQQVTDRVRELYEEIGWKESGGVTYDAETGEDLRPSAQDYIAATRRRVLRHLPAQGDKLIDMASGPIQYPEYLEYSQGFRTRVCVDLSQRALDSAKAKIGDHGEYLCGDFMELEIPEGSIDAAVSLHTIYHIHADRQPAVVRKLLRILKPGGTLVVIYSNPKNIVSRVTAPIRRLLGRTNPKDGARPETIYFEPQPLEWWRQFEDAATVRIYPWRTFSTPVQKLLFPAGGLGRKMLAILFRLEDRMPDLFARIGVYPMIVLQKRA
jgi:ubiquinone/menaquinone biosynthesis C-methylase UbiE